ncbi:GFA family protein [Bradyrhizobium sp. HKCCYLS3077]|uniref:GFA family protein n=1 Tax=Bradyrhizobium sp. HKCCYLS3077 TaxID=3420761 RepID=UPI003EC055AB
MTHAQCACGSLRLLLRAPSKMVVACHCLACQRRTGAPFGVNAFYAIETVEISGPSTEFVHVGESGRNVRMFFCPTCGSTVYWKPDALPSMIGVAVGALADPDFPAPAISVFERSKHHWVNVEGPVAHFPASGMRDAPLS